MSYSCYVSWTTFHWCNHHHTSTFGLDLFVPMKINLNAATEFVHLCVNSLCLSLSCFNTTMLHKQMVFPVWCQRTWLALTSTPSNTFGMNWNTDCWLGLTDALVSEWEHKVNLSTCENNLVYGRFPVKAFHRCSCCFERSLAPEQDILFYEYRINLCHPDCLSTLPDCL